MGAVPPMNSPSTAERTPAPSRINLRQSADPRYVLADRVEQLYSQMPLAVISTLLVSVIAAYELREGRYFEVLLFWGALVLLLTVARLGLYWSYRRSRDKINEA